LRQFPLSKNAGLKRPFGQLVVHSPDTNESVVVRLTPYRFVIIFAVIRKLLRLKGVLGGEVPLEDVACVTAEIEEAFRQFSEVYENETTISFVPSDLSGTLLDTRKGLASRGLNDLLRGDLRKGLLIAAHPDNIMLRIDRHLQAVLEKDNLHGDSIACQDNPNDPHCTPM
jgi:hypothetical protein